MRALCVLSLSAILSLTPPLTLSGQVLIPFLYGVSGVRLIAGTCAGSTDSNTITTTAIDTRGANFVVVSVSSSDTTPANINLSDSASNTFTKLSNNGADGGGGTNFLAYAANATTASNYTVTAAEGSSFPSICVAAFRSVKPTSPFGTQTGSVGTAATTFQPGSITPAKATDLVVVAIEGGTTVGTLSINSGFTIVSTVGFTSSQHYPNGLAYLISPAGAAVNPTWTSTISTTASLSIATFSSQ